MKRRMGRVVLIHGARFRRRDKENMRQLAKAFRAVGFTVVMPTYGYFPSLMIGLFQWFDRRIADSMSAFIRSEDVLLGHSNGGTLVYLISRIQRIKGAILVNPALDTDRVPRAKFVHVYFNEGDIIGKLSGLIPFHIWGRMGGVGYLGDDLRVVNIDQNDPPGDLPPLYGHSDVFSPLKVGPWARFMAELCLRAVQRLKENRHGYY